MEVLVSAMELKNFDLVEKMNIRTDAIIINQTNKFNKEIRILDENRITMYSLDEKGVGLSRNNALMRSTADICLFADEDMVFKSDYEKKILEAFHENPKADIVLFNVKSLNPSRPTAKIIKNKRVYLYNSLKYGAVNIAFRRQSILKNNIFFSLLFGGGTKYSAGEDSLFLFECFKKKLVVCTSKSVLGYVSQEDSSWFDGYNKKYFIDKGAFFGAMSSRFSKFLIIQDIIRKKSLYQRHINLFKAFQLMLIGDKEFKGECGYD